jgi:hypothetical protein
VDKLLRDTKGNAIDGDYIEKVNQEGEIGYDLDNLVPARVGRPSLSQAGDSPQISVPPLGGYPGRSRSIRSA